LELRLKLVNAKYFKLLLVIFHYKPHISVFRNSHSVFGVKIHPKINLVTEVVALVFANCVAASEEFKYEWIGGILMAFSNTGMFSFWCELYNLINFNFILSQSACLIETKSLNIGCFCRFLRLCPKNIVILESNQWKRKSHIEINRISRRYSPAQYIHQSKSNKQLEYVSEHYIQSC